MPNNKPAHVHGYPDNLEEFYNEELGRGAGDGDLYGYPGQAEAEEQTDEPIL